jgi:amino acid transporter
MSEDTAAVQSGGEDARRLGTFGGVFTPSILTILGVIMYLRVGWCVGHAGLAGMLIIVVISHVISAATGLSVSSIATNRTVGAGGAYFMISRSLGAPAGGAIGIPLFFAQALSVTFYIVGFTEALGYIIGPNPPWYFDPRLLGTGTLVLLTLIALKSAEAALKMQYFIMAGIVLSLISFFFGRSDAQPQEIEMFASGTTKTFGEVFAVFFPAVTGIMAGVSMSGDLKDSRKSLPKGTMLAILGGFIVYMIVPIILAMNYDLETLRTNNQTVFDMSLMPALIYVGVWGATLSSAVGSILAAPRTLQALAIDGMAPQIFARGSGPANEPRNGLIFTFILAEIGILIGSLDLIAPVLTMFFLATYGITNTACALEKWAASPVFRPTFKVSAWVSAGGAFACFYVMSIINIGAMVAAAAICAAIYIYIERRNLNTTYGDARHGMWSALVRTSLRHLHRSAFHPMNWRPNLVIFGGPPKRRQHLLDLGASLVQERGIVSYIQLLRGRVRDLADQRPIVQKRLDDFSEDFPNVFFRTDIVPDVYRGAVTVTQSYGIGALEANSVMLGWLQKKERAAPYFAMLRDLTHLHNSIFLVRKDPKSGFGRRREIHVWWGGLEANGAMMLLLAYLITSDNAWRGAKVTCLTVVDSEADRAKAEQGLKRVILNARLVAEPKVLLRDGRQIAEIMRSESERADLAIIGLRLPLETDEPMPEDINMEISVSGQFNMAEVPEPSAAMEEEAKQRAEALFEHYNSLLADLPTTILVHSALDFEGAPVLFDE